MKVYTHNFNPKSDSGPNKFTRQLFKKLIENHDVHIVDNQKDALEYNEYGTSAWNRALDNRYIEISRTYQYKQYGGSVRCIKGEMPDCNGVPGGSAIVDCQGICGGDTVEDCSGKCGGTATECVYDIDGNEK